MKWLQSFLDNNSLFGRLMTRCGILIAANVLFLVFSLPLVTIGASWTALYYTMLKTLHGDGELNPFRIFWQGFRENFKQATEGFLLMVLLAAFLILELFWCSQFPAPVSYFRYGLMALLLAEFVIAAYLFPVMAAFRGTLPELLQDCIYFAFQRPAALLQILFLHIFPILITYLDSYRLPLYAFCWCVIGFSAIAMTCANLLIRQFAPLLSSPTDADAPGPRAKSEQETLDEMQKLGM